MRLVIVLGVLALLPVTAFAQMVPPPMGEEPKMTIGGSATLWLPQDDAEDTSDESLGLRAHFTYKFKDWLAGIGTFDYVFVNEETDGDATYYNLNAGARFIKSRPGQIEPYGEVLLGYYVLDAEGADSESEIGFRIGGGILYPFSQTLLANAGLNYSTVSFDFGLADFDVAAIILELGIAVKI